MNPLRVLLLEDDPVFARDFCANLRNYFLKKANLTGWDSIEIRHVTNQQDADLAVREVGQDGYDLVFLDLRYPESTTVPLEPELEKSFRGMRWLPILRRLQPGSAIVIITSYPQESQLLNVVNAIRDSHADDFIPKTATLDDIIARVLVALQHARRKHTLYVLEMELDRLMTKRVARAFLEDALAIIDRSKAVLMDIARRLESGDPSSAARAPDEIRAICSSTRRNFVEKSETFGVGKEQPVRVDVAELIRRTLSLYETRLEDIGAKAVQCGEQGELTIVTYGDDLRIALHEILCNAIYALRTSAAPLGEREIRCDLRRSGKGATIAVTDNGKGFGQQEIEHMFEPGYSSHKDEVHMGLGLYIAKRMVEGIGGVIEPRNRPEGGAGVVLTIPDLGEP